MYNSSLVTERRFQDEKGLKMHESSILLQGIMPNLDHDTSVIRISFRIALYESNSITHANVFYVCIHGRFTCFAYTSSSEKRTDWFPSRL